MRRDAEVVRDAHAVFLPAIDESTLPDHLADHLAGGGTSVLLGESRQEYVARAMAQRRRSTETRRWFSEMTSDIRARAGGRALVAVDQELGGIQRLHGLVTALPALFEAVATDQGAIEAVAARLAEECVALGVNVVLSPIVDVVTGTNPWLEGRTISSDAGTVREIATGFVRGLQRSGQVAATAKHFPGHPRVPLDPAVDERAAVEAGLAEIEPSLDTFRAVIGAGVRVVMTGPALVPALDSERAASRSVAVVDALRSELGFRGVILSDDLDAPGILRGGTLEDAVVEALVAGVDWLLVAGTPHLPDLVAAAVDAARDGRLDAGRLTEAARAVRSLTDDLA